jgi:hypothetical protein
MPLHHRHSPPALSLALAFAGLLPAAQAITPATQDLLLAPATPLWIDISPPGLESTSPMEIAFTPKNPEMIYLGSALSGLFRTTDFGRTWTQNYDDFYVNPYVPTTWVTDVVFDPANPDYGIAGTMSGSYLTIDGGDSWTRQSAPMPTMCTDLASLETSGRVVAADVEGDLHTFDWSTLLWSEGVPIEGQPNEIAVDASDPTNLYVAAFGNNPGGSMWISRDQGDSFYSFTEGLPQLCGSVVADPDLPGHAIAVSRDELYFTDMGPVRASRPVWFPLPAVGLPEEVDILCLLYDPIDGDRLYAGTAGEGVYFSENNGYDWRPLPGDGMEARYVIDLAISGSHPELILAACHVGGPDYGRLYRTEVPPRLHRPGWSAR